MSRSVCLESGKSEAREPAKDPIHRPRDITLGMSRTQEAAPRALDEMTWNHPVVAHGKLFVRNGAEAACYDLAREY